MGNELGAIASAMVDQGNEYVANDLMTLIQLDSMANLRISAQNFLNAYNYIEEINKAVKTAYLSQRTKFKNQTKNFNKKDFKKSDVYKVFQTQRADIYNQLQEDAVYEFFRQMLIFEQQIQLFLGKKVSTIYVYQGAAGKTQLYELNGDVRDIFQIGYSSQNKLTGSYKRNLDLNAVGKLINYQEQGYNSKGLDITHSEVLARGRYSKQKLNLKSKMKIFWNTNGKWQSVDVISEGDINEAYAGFYLSKDETFNNHGLEHNVGYFLTSDKYGVVNVDTTSSLLQGDISIDGDQDYAIKSFGASMAGYSQMVKIAQGIQKGDIFNKKTLLAKLKKGKTRNKLASLLDEEIDLLLSGIRSEGGVGYHFEI